MIAHIFKGLGRKVGMTSTDGVVIDERLVYQGRRLRPKSARMVLQNPRVDFAVMEVARGGILREGLGYDRNDVAVVTNVAPDHLGMQRHRHPRAARRRQGRRRRGGAARRFRGAQRRRRRSSARCAAAAPASVVWFSLQPPGSEVREFIDDHCRRGGRAVVLEPHRPGDMIVIRHGRRSMQLAWTHLLPVDLRRHGEVQRRQRHGRGRRGVRRRRRRCTTSARACARSPRRYYLSPGRMNLLNVHNVDVFVDYCHNAPGMRVLGDFVERYAAQKAGQADLGKAVAHRHDRRRRRPARRRHARAGRGGRRPLRRRRRPRGRSACAAAPAGEAAELVAEGAEAGSARRARRCRQVEIVLDELDAVRHCMARANPGDLVVLCVDQHADVLGELEQLTTAPRPARTTAAAPATPTSTPGRCRTRPRPQPAPRRRRPNAEPPRSDPPRPAAGTAPLGTTGAFCGAAPLGTAAASC